MKNLKRSVKTMPIKCWRRDCKFRDKRGYCILDSIEIDEEGKCDDYEQDEKKKIIEHNTKMAGLLERLGKLNIDEKSKKELATLLVLGMKTDDGELVLDKITEALKEGGDGD